MTTTAEDVLDPRLLTIMQLSAEDIADLSPQQAAHICEYDRDAILEFIKVSSEQEIEWRASITNPTHPADNPQICAHEADAWMHTTGLLRAALKATVLRGDSETA